MSSDTANLLPKNLILETRRRLDFQIFKIDTQFDIEELRRIVSHILGQEKLIPKDGYKNYSGIGLQYSDEKDPIYDAVEQIAFIRPDQPEIKFRNKVASEFSQINELGKLFPMVFQMFEGIGLLRGRILNALPGHSHKTHIDGERDCRIHIPIFTNSDCFMKFGTKSYHLPADGSSYLCNTSTPHSFGNLGKTERVHLVFVI